MIKDSAKNNAVKYILYVFSFGLIFYIMTCCPMINDDYSFLSYGLKSFGEIFRFSLYYGNGRLIGNITSLLLIDKSMLFAAEKAVILFLTILLVSRFADRKRQNEIFVLTFILVMGVSPFIFQEVFTWSTCFQNYVVPVTGMIMCLSLINYSGEKFSNAAVCVMIFILGFTSQLYLELNTLVDTALAFIIAVICYKADRRKFSKAAVFSISSVLGAVLMLAIPRLFKDSKRMEVMENYRGVHLGSVRDFIYNFSDNTNNLVHLLGSCLILLAFLGAALIITVNASDCRKLYKVLCSIGAALLPVYCIAVSAVRNDILFPEGTIYKLLFNAFVAIGTVSAFFCLMSMKKCREKILALIALAFSVISIAPLTVVSPVKPRCAFLYYFFLVSLTVILYSINLKEGRIGKVFNTLAMVCALAVSINLCISFYNIKKESVKQTADIEAQLAKKPQVINVIEINNPYMHLTKETMYGYYYYREKPFDTQFVYVPFDEPQK